MTDKVNRIDGFEILDDDPEIPRAFLILRGVLELPPGTDKIAEKEKAWFVLEEAMGRADKRRRARSLTSENFHQEIPKFGHVDPE